ncbi:thermonuclease family protein [bacterium]|nr:thermonuclease family protein [bacterium]
MNKRCVLVVILITCFSAGAYARSQKVPTGYGNIQGAKYIRNYDGDTITDNIPGYPPIIGENISIRMNGIDTPEIKGKCAREKALAKKARQQVRSLLVHARNIELRNIQRGKYFRIVADVWIDGLSINQILIREKLAVPYDGGRKTFLWCE